MPTRSTRKASASPTKHEQLTQQLLGLLSDLQPGDRLPSQTELMRRYAVSDRTVLRSLDDLRRAGRIVRRHGKGTFVADAGNDLDAADTSLGLPAAPGPQTDTVAALATSTVSFYKYALDVLTAEVVADGLTLVCHHTQHPGRYGDALPLEALRPRGFILFSFSLAPLARRLRDNGHRVVLFGTPPVDGFAGVPCVYGDQEHGGYVATRHLLDRGHRRIAFAFNEAAFPHPLTQRLRWRGHQRAARESGIAARLITPEMIAEWEGDASAAARFFAAPDAPTGIAAWNDTTAIQLLGIFHRAGLRVPDDISLIGYDALPAAALTCPVLTTVDGHVDSQIRAAVDLLTRSTAPSPEYTLVFRPDVVERASTAPPQG